LQARTALRIDGDVVEFRSTSRRQSRCALIVSAMHICDAVAAPLAYFTDGDDVVLIASNYGGKTHPAWYHNLRAQPECQLHIGPRGGSFLAKEAVGADRDRLYELAADRLSHVFTLHDKRSGEARTIPVMRLTPVEETR
jgi:deazaflavin-dependent oxidoreductase (nitroreductase family)